MKVQNNIEYSYIYAKNYYNDNTIKELYKTTH